VELSCAPASDHPYFVRCAKRFDVALSEQGSGDLGERMLDAARRALTRAEAVILLGSDCAALGVQDLREASSVLAEGRDAVLGPVEDGGYYLLGLRRPAAELFDGIEWSTSTVLGETRRRLAALRWHCHELPTRWDVDRPDDYRRMQQKGLLPAGTVRASFQ
jgi:rSAM/selenodomain-associated transferase 1